MSYDPKVAVSITVPLSVILQAREMVEQLKARGTEVSLSSFVASAIELALTQEAEAVKGKLAAHE